MSVPFPTVAAPPLVSALLRARPEDFVVSEELGFPLTGSGEHVWLRVRKRGLNTDQVAGHLARRAGLSRRDVSYSGMKDRHAVTEQWFSAWLPRTDVANWQEGMPEGIEVLEVTRHSRKLQRGAHRANRFVISLRECSGDEAAVERRLADIARDGVPNYFGEQRFGRDGDNVAHAEAMFAGTEVVTDRHRRGIYLSAARSFLFNQVLARRVNDGSWNRILPGEALMLDGKNSFFASDGADATLPARLDRHDIHPSGPLWGEGELPSRGEVRVLEEGAVLEHRPLADGLAAAGLRQERRALRLIPAGFSHQWLADGIEARAAGQGRPDCGFDAATLRLEFSLPRGAYATAVLREVADYRNAAGSSVAADSGD